MLCPSCWGTKKIGSFIKKDCEYCNKTGAVKDIKITENFFLSEMVRSSLAVRKKIENIPDKTSAENLIFVCKALEIIRNKFGALRINSAFRSPELNKALGSKDTSAHTVGLAVDFVPANENIKLNTIIDWIIKESDLLYDQVIYEGTWIHFGIKNKTGQQRKQNLMMFGGKYEEYNSKDPRIN